MHDRMQENASTQSHKFDGSTRLGPGACKTELPRPGGRHPVGGLQQQSWQLRRDCRWERIHPRGLQQERVVAITGQIISQCVSPARNMRCNQFKLEMGFNEEEAPQQVHERRVPARPARDAMHRCLIVAKALHPSATPPLPPDRTRKEHGEQLLVCDMVGASHVRALKLELTLAAPRPTPPVSRGIGCHLEHRGLGWR